MLPAWPALRRMFPLASGAIGAAMPLSSPAIPFFSA